MSQSVGNQQGRRPQGTRDAVDSSTKQELTLTPEFSQLNLHPQTVQNLTELGYTTPTPIQAAIIPPMLDGQDVIGQAQTGTGKTAAFALPILQNLEPDQHHVQTLVLAPTRELAIQVAEAIFKYGRFPGVRVLPVYGGQSYSRQIGRLKKGVDVVVGTPGRLLDLIERNVLDLSRVSTVVLDEADEMLSMGFIDDIEQILNQTPATRQTALFSATLPQPIRRLADRYMRNPQSCTIERDQLTVDTIEQRYCLTNESDKLAVLTRLFEVEEISSALIFARTRVGTGQLATELTGRGFPAEVLNGDLSQEARVQVLNRFRNGQITVLVATDVAARGLDIDDISHVFNFDLPDDPEVYVHRVGRTGRAGKTGIAVTLLTPRELWRLRKIEAYTRQKITRTAVPTVEEIQTHRDTQVVEHLTMWLRRGRGKRERDMVAQLVEAGHDPADIATAALKMARAEEKQRPIAPVSEVQDIRPRKSGRKNGRERSRNGRESGMVRLSLSTGKADGVRVNHVVGALAHYAEIPGRALGKIVIQDRRTLVDVPEQFVGRVLAKTGKYRIGRQSLSVERA
ncbi:MAG: DEAD/DEAH box helicase [Chloroflexi bacterium]|nr:MAG: DEAD/DEAH box helicase [Chloroflexota bacterium]